MDQQWLSMRASYMEFNVSSHFSESVEVKNRDIVFGHVM